MSATVYFSREITPEKVLELYKLAGKELTGNVAVKIHSGEKGNQNFLRPEFWKPVIDHVGGTVVECNTAYAGERNTTAGSVSFQGSPHGRLRRRSEAAVHWLCFFLRQGLHPWCR